MGVNSPLSKSIDISQFCDDWQNALVCVDNVYACAHWQRVVTYVIGHGLPFWENDIKPSCIDTCIGGKNNVELENNDVPYQDFVSAVPIAACSRNLHNQWPKHSLDYRRVRWVGISPLPRRWLSLEWMSLQADSTRFLSRHSFLRTAPWKTWFSRNFPQHYMGKNLEDPNVWMGKNQL